jgi:transmembrane sensor
MTSDERMPDPDQEPDWARLGPELAQPGSVDVRTMVPDDERAPERARLLAALAAALRAPEPPPLVTHEVERALATVMARRDVLPMREPRVGAPRRRSAWSAAAAVLAATVIGSAWLAYHGGRESAAWERATATRATVLETGVGRVDSVRLPDGSRAVLGPGSQLQAWGGYGGRHRTVVLRGEAWFDVVHDDDRPFTVLTAHAEVHDVGTTFDVRDAAGGAIVTVQRGAVDVQRRFGDAPEHPRVERLRAGDRATVPAAGDVRVERGAASDADVAWTRGRLVLRDAAVPEIADALRRWYGLDFRVSAGALGDRRVTASFERESGADAARIIAAAMGGAARIVGDTVHVEHAERRRP